MKGRERNMDKITEIKVDCKFRPNDGITNICKELSLTCALVVEKTIKEYVDYKNEKERSKCGERIIINKIIEMNTEWQTIEFFKFKGETKFQIQQRWIKNTIEYRIVT